MVLSSQTWRLTCHDILARDSWEVGNIYTPCSPQLEEQWYQLIVRVLYIVCFWWGESTLLVLGDRYAVHHLINTTQLMIDINIYAYRSQPGPIYTPHPPTNHIDESKNVLNRAPKVPRIPSNSLIVTSRPFDWPDEGTLGVLSIHSRLIFSPVMIIDLNSLTTPLLPSFFLVLTVSSFSPHLYSQKPQTRIPNQTNQTTQNGHHILPPTSSLRLRCNPPCPSNPRKKEPN